MRQRGRNCSIIPRLINTNVSVVGESYGGDGEDNGGEPCFVSDIHLTRVVTFDDDN